MQEAELGADGVRPIRAALLHATTALGLDPHRRVAGLSKQFDHLAPALLVELELRARDRHLGMVEARLAAGRRRALEDLRQRAAQRLAAERRRQARPLLVVEPRLGRRAV